VRELAPTQTLVLYDGSTLKLCKMYGADWKPSAQPGVRSGRRTRQLISGKAISAVAFQGMLHGCNKPLVSNCISAACRFLRTCLVYSTIILPANLAGA
jgi:hypothetical protein